jgi:hypothetical protein
MEVRNTVGIGDAPGSQLSGEVAPRVWAIRAGSGGVHAGVFLAIGRVGIGFAVQSSVEGLGWEAITALAKSAMPGQPAVTVGLATGALYRIASEIREGDIVITPEPGGTLLAGAVSGPYECRNPPMAQDFVHTRPVRWFARVERSTLSETARNSLGSLQTVFFPSTQPELLGTLLALTAQATPPPLAGVSTSTSVQTIPANPVDPVASSGATISADTPDLNYLLVRMENRDLALPAFQRSFVWDAGATRELLVSIARGFPAGSLLFLKGGSEIFSPRAVEGAPELKAGGAEVLVLDGQQRLTSLYQALRGKGNHAYFLDIGALMKGTPLDDAVRVYRTDRAKSWETKERQARDLMFPFARLDDFLNWRDDVLDVRSKDGATSAPDIAVLKPYLNKVHDAIISPIRNYKFPVTTLGALTPTEAVLTIFETLNRTGLKLSVFELITARVFEHFKLRDKWADAQSKYPTLSAASFDVDPYYILQTIALRLKRVPQRGVVLVLEIDALKAHWDEAVVSMHEVLVALRDEWGVLTPKFLPYAPMLPTLAAAWAGVRAATGSQVGARKLKLQRWFWCASFAGEYDSSANSKAASDVPLLREWLNDGVEPPAVVDFDFDPREWLRTTARQRGLYRATMALVARGRPLDFHSVKPLTEETIKTEQVDDHHVFPYAYLQEKGITGYVDTVLNHTYIDHITNVRIGKRAPSDYLADIEKDLTAHLSEVLVSHSLPPEKDGPLWRDDFKGFLEWRLERLAAELEAVTLGTAQPATSVSAATLIEQGEGAHIEFKSTARYNNHTGNRDQVLEKEVALTVAAFMNGKGGSLLLGVNDAGTPLGLDLDFKTLRDSSDDAFERALLDLLQTYLGKPALAYVAFQTEAVGGIKLARLDVRPSSSKVFLKAPGQDGDEFYVRFGSTSRKLTHQEADQYARDRFRVE